MLAAVAARIVPGDGAGPTWPTAEQLDCAGKIDALLASVHPDVGSDFRRLLRLFESSVLGALTAGSPRPFTRATPADQDARLEAWRRSRLAVLRSGYQALKRLSQATYYCSPEVYALHRLPGSTRGAGGAGMSATTPAKRGPGRFIAGAELAVTCRSSRSTSRSWAAARAAAPPPRCWPRRAPRSRSSRRAGTTRGATSTCRKPGPTRPSTRSTATARPKISRS